MKSIVSLILISIVYLGLTNNASAFIIHVETNYEASSPVDTSLDATDTSNKSIEADLKADLDDFPNLHPLVVHFPIALLLIAVFLQLIQLFVMERTLDWVILLMVGAGFLGAYIAGTYVHPYTSGLTEVAKGVLEQHDKYADWTLWSSALAAVLKIFSLFKFKFKRVFESGVFAVMLFAAYSVAQAGHYGAQLVYIEGVGPQGQFLSDDEQENHDEESNNHSH